MAQDDPPADPDKPTQWAEFRTDLAEDRTIMATERTYAGWLRTAFAAIGIGLGFRAVFGDFDPPWLARAIATMFILAGAWLALAAAHRARFVRVGGKTDGDGAAIKRGEPVANRLAGSRALTRDDGILDTRQFPDEAPARGDHQIIVLDNTRRGAHAPAALLDRFHDAEMPFDPVLREEARERHGDFAGIAHLRRHPDQARQIDQTVARRHDRDLRIDILPAQFADRGQCRKTASQNGDACHQNRSIILAFAYIMERTRDGNRQ